MHTVAAKHLLKLLVSVDEVVVAFKVDEVVVNGVINESNLGFFPRDRLLESHEICKIVIDEVLGGHKRCRMRKA